MEISVYDRAFPEYRYSGRREEGLLTVYQLDNETGAGELSCFEVLPGVQIIYNCLNMATCFQKVRAGQGFLQINHCRAGCFELELDGGMAGFIGEGDLAVNNPGCQQIVNSRLPLGRYRGITILLEMEQARTSLETLFPRAGIDLFLLREKLCSGNVLLLLRARPEVEHIFSELYRVDARIRET